MRTVTFKVAAAALVLALGGGFLVGRLTAASVEPAGAGVAAQTRVGQGGLVGLPDSGASSGKNSDAGAEHNTYNNYNTYSNYADQGAAQNGSVSTYRDPETGDIVTSIIAPRQSQDQRWNEPLMVAPQVYPGYVNPNPPYPPGPGPYPPGSYPPGSYPPGSYPPGSYPPGSYPPGPGPVIPSAPTTPAIPMQPGMRPGMPMQPAMQPGMRPSMPMQPAIQPGMRPSMPMQPAMQPGMRPAMRPGANSGMRPDVAGMVGAAPAWRQPGWQGTAPPQGYLPPGYRPPAAGGGSWPHSPDWQPGPRNNAMPPARTLRPASPEGYGPNGPKAPGNYAAPGMPPLSGVRR